MGVNNDRNIAYLTLLRMNRENAYSHIELNNQLTKHKAYSESFVRELVYGVLERLYTLDYYLEQLLKSGIDSLKTEPLTILRMGLYQIIYMDSVPNYSAVNESVNLAKEYCYFASKMVNAVLRNCIRKAEQLTNPSSETGDITRLKYTYSYEPWIIRLWIEQYGIETAENLLDKGNRTPGIDIRCNRLKTTAEELKRSLAEKGMDVEISTHDEDILTVRGRGLLSLDEYKEGKFSVQDKSSYRAVSDLDPKPGDIVIDVCAAPGGKSFASAERMNNIGTIYSFDTYDEKVKRMEKEADRLGIDIVRPELVDGVVGIEKYFGSADKVICDVPCTGLGVLHRKPEIKYRKISDSGKALAKKQLAILERSTSYLKDGGTMMYSTCTINSIENRGVIAEFLKRNSEFQLLVGRQLLPTTDDTDGFYYCLLKKKY